MEIPTACPVCGAYSITQDTRTSTLLAVCDVLVVKALENLGMKIVRHGRDRYHLLAHRPYHLAHTLWPPSDPDMNKALNGAWDVVPALIDSHGCCDATPAQVSRLLDDYVRDLAITGTPHALTHLAYRFESRLDLPVWLHTGTEMADA